MKLAYWQAFFFHDQIQDLVVPLKKWWKMALSIMITSQLISYQYNNTKLKNSWLNQQVRIYL